TYEMSIQGIGNGEDNVTNTFSTITEYLPKSIEYNRVKVIFKYKMNGQNFLMREDVDNGGAILEYIEVIDKQNPSEKIKNFKLTTTYFTSGDSGPLPSSLWGGSTGTTYGVLFKRLILKKVEDLIANTFFEFEYV